MDRPPQEDVHPQNQPPCRLDRESKSDSALCVVPEFFIIRTVRDKMERERIRFFDLFHERFKLLVLCFAGTCIVLDKAKVTD